MGLLGQVVFSLNQVKTLLLRWSFYQIRSKYCPTCTVFDSRFGAIQPNSMKVDDLYKVALMLLDRALEDNSQVTLVASRIL